MKLTTLRVGAGLLVSLGMAATAASAQAAPAKAAPAKAAPAQTPPAEAAGELSLTRLDCGKTTTLADVSRFSDVAAFNGLSVQLTFSCYLVKHGNDISFGTPAIRRPRAPRLRPPHRKAAWWNSWRNCT